MVYIRKASEWMVRTIQNVTVPLTPPHAPSHDCFDSYDYKELLHRVRLMLFRLLEVISCLVIAPHIPPANFKYSTT
jgi:hypothetical protein